MQKPLELSIRDLKNHPIIEEVIMEKIVKLEKMNHKIISCHIFIRKPHKRHNKGNAFSVRIDVKLPNDRIVVNCQSSIDLSMLIHEAFEIVQRQLKKYTKRKYTKRKLSYESFLN